MNLLHQILSPNKNDDGVWIHQNAWFFIGKFTKSMIIKHKIRKDKNGLYIFIIEGDIIFQSKIFRKRDSIAIQDYPETTLKVLNSAQLLLMDIPMSFN